MAKGWKRLFKILGILLGTLLGLLLLVLAAFPVFLHTSALDKTVLRILSSQVEGTVQVGDVRISPLRHLPDLTVSVEDLLVTYPHDRFAPLAPEGDEGRGAQVDTLLGVAHLEAGADLKAFLKEQRLLVHRLKVEQLSAFARQYDDTTANWQILRFLGPKDTVKESSFALSEIRLDELSVTRPRIVYSDRSRNRAATLAWKALDAEGSFGADSSLIDARVRLRELDLGALLSTLGPSLSPRLSGIGTDGLLNVTAQAQGPLRLDAGAALPPAKVQLELPKSRWSWKGYFDGAELRLSAQGENTDRGVQNLALDNLLFHLDGVDLSASGLVRDLLGRDPLYEVDARGTANLEKAFRYLPASLRSAFSASGQVDLDLQGKIRQSQLSPYRCAGADLKGKLVGDIIRIADPQDTLFCYLAHPVISVGTMDSAVDAADRAIAATVAVDSLDVDLGSSLCAQGTNLLLFAQNASQAISADSKWHPLVGKLTSDRLVVRGADSLVVGTRKNQVRFTVTPLVREESVTPYLRLESEHGRLLYRTPSALFSAVDASVVASAQMQERRAGQDSVRRQRRAARDTAAVPDYLQEKDFRAADISFQVNQSLSRLLRGWNPALQLQVARGLFATPAFPLRTRYRALSASLQDDVVRIESLLVSSGTSDVALSGTLKGLKRGLTRGRTRLEIDADLRSDRLNLNEIITAIDKGKDRPRPQMEEGLQIDEEAFEAQVVYDSLTVEPLPVGSTLLVVPANVNADVRLDVGRVDYSKTVLNEFHAGASMQQRCIRLDDVRATTDMGNFGLDAFYATRTKQDLAVGFNLRLHDVTAEKVIDLFPGIDAVTPMLKSFKGQLDCEMAATSQLDTNMNFVLPTLDGMFKIHGEQLVLEDLGSLKKIARTLRFKDQMSGRIDEMTVNGVISDNTLEVFPFILAIDRYTVALQGVQHLNKSFDYHVSLIKSPLIMKLGINIFGPSFEEWKFRLGKPKYRSTKVPLFNEEVDSMQLNLATSIKNVFTVGVDRVLQENHEAQAAIGDKKRELSYDSGTELLTVQEQNELEHLMIEQDLEEETAALEAEIDRIIASML